MTRINTIDPKHLADQHLFAEYREIYRVPDALQKALASKGISRVLAEIPEEYTLGTGHVYWAFDKMNWLYERYQKLVDELMFREYNISQSDPVKFLQFSLEFCNGFRPSTKDHHVNLERIVSKIDEKPTFYRYLGNKMPSTFFTELYNTNYDYQAGSSSSTDR